MTTDYIINFSVIDKLAQLASLDFNEQEKCRLKNDLAQILAFIKKIKNIDTSNIEPMSHCVIKQQRLRQDVVTEVVDQQQQMKKQNMALQINISKDTGKKVNEDGSNNFYCVPKMKK